MQHILRLGRSPSHAVNGRSKTWIQSCFQIGALRHSRGKEPVGRHGECKQNSLFKAVLGGCFHLGLEIVRLEKSSDSSLTDRWEVWPSALLTDDWLQRDDKTLWSTWVLWWDVQPQSTKKEKGLGIAPQAAELKVFEDLLHSPFAQYSCVTFEKSWKRKLGSVWFQC